MHDLLSKLLGPRLGHVPRTWPQPLYAAVERLANREGKHPEHMLLRMLADRDDDMLSSLVASATVCHTSFMRHAEHFEHLEEVLPRMAAKVGRPLRIWSAGCATGEEPYSIAATAVRTGTPVRILATDVNPEALAVARQASYAPASVPDGIAPATLRAMIRFEEASLVDANPTLGLGPFDIVFCRNVLIYFEREAKNRILELLFRSVAPHGSVVVAPVEGALHFQQRAPGAPLGWLSPKPPPPRVVPQRPLTIEARRPPLPSAPRWQLGLAGERLRAGDLDGAELIARRLLDQDPEHGEAWLLLGRILLGRDERAQARVAYCQAARFLDIDPENDAREGPQAA